MGAFITNCVAFVEKLHGEVTKPVKQFFGNGNTPFKSPKWSETNMTWWLDDKNFCHSSKTLKKQVVKSGVTCCSGTKGLWDTQILENKRMAANLSCKAGPFEWKYSLIFNFNMCYLAEIFSLLFYLSNISDINCPPMSSFLKWLLAIELFIYGSRGSDIRDGRLRKAAHSISYTPALQK